PVRPHLASVVVIRADAETEPLPRKFIARRGAAGRNFRRRVPLRLRHFVTDRHRVCDRNAWPAIIGKESKRRLGPDLLLTHHVRKNFDRRTGTVFTAKSENRDDHNSSEQVDEEKSAQHISPRARW